MLPVGVEVEAAKTPQACPSQRQSTGAASAGCRPQAGGALPTASGGGRAEPQDPGSVAGFLAPMPAAGAVVVESLAVETHPPPARPGCAGTGGSLKACWVACSRDPLTLTWRSLSPGERGEGGLPTSW